MPFFIHWKKSLRLFQPSTPLLPVQPRTSRQPTTSASRSCPITAMTSCDSFNEPTATFPLRPWLHLKHLDCGFLWIFLLGICAPFPHLRFCISLERMQENSRNRECLHAFKSFSFCFQGLAARKHQSQWLFGSRKSYGTFQQCKPGELYHFLPRTQCAWIMSLACACTKLEVYRGV